MSDLLFYLALLLQLGLALWAILATLKEQASLRRCVAQCEDPDSAEKATKNLGGMQGVIAGEMVESVRLRSTLDDALVKAIARASETPWTPTLALVCGLQALTVGLVLAPASLSLLKAAHTLGAHAATITALPTSSRYLQAPLALQDTFIGVREGFSRTAILLAGLAIVWAIAWWLRRPLAREARFVQALLHIATRIRPGTSAPVAARLAQLVAPQNAFTRPVAAVGIWFVAITAGWAVLLGTASLRAANHTEPNYSVWPVKGRTAITHSTDLKLPVVHGGVPFVDQGLATITVSPQSIMFQGRAFASIEDGGLGPDWPPNNVQGMRQTLQQSDAVTIVADQRVSATRALVPLIGWLKQDAGVKHYHLLVSRDLSSGAAQADLLISASQPDDAPGLTITVQGKQLSVGQTRVPNSRSGWRNDVRVAVRRIDELLLTKQRRAVQVKLQGEVSYQQLAQSLGAADDSCAGDSDCGLPGLGLRLVLAVD